MIVDVQGQALSVLSKLAQADWPDRLKVRKSFEKLVYSGSRASFRLAAGGTSNKPRAAADELFDLSLTEELQMLVDMLQSFALEVLRPAAHEADAQAQVPAALLNQAHELGLAHYGVAEAQGGLAGERTVLSNALIAESLAQGDFSLAAALLVPLSAANCIRRWGSVAQQAAWLPAFVSEDGAPSFALAVSDPGVLNDPAQPATRARKRCRHYLLDGEKTLVIAGLDASRLIVSAQANDGPALFIVDATSKGISRRAGPGMGLKACGLTRIQLKGVKVPGECRLAGDGFDFPTFLDYSTLAFCALAVGTAQAALD